MPGCFGPVVKSATNPNEAQLHTKEMTEMDTILKPAPEAATAARADTDLVQIFTAAFTTDDVESFYKLIDPDCEWVIVATSESFRGLDQVKQLATRSVAGRDH